MWWYDLLLWNFSCTLQHRHTFSVFDVTLVFLVVANFCVVTVDANDNNNNKQQAGEEKNLRKKVCVYGNIHLYI